MGRSIEELFGAEEEVKKMLEEFKAYWSRTQSIPLREAPKGEIAKTLYTFMIPRFQLLSPDFKKYFSKEETRDVRAKEKKGIAKKTKEGTLVSLDRTRLEFKGRGFKASPAVDRHFSYYSRNTMLSDIAKTKKGNCLAITALYTAIGRRLGLDVKPVRINPSHAAPEVVIGGKKVVIDPLLKKVVPVSRLQKPPRELTDRELFLNAVKSKERIQRITSKKANPVKRVLYRFRKRLRH